MGFRIPTRVTIALMMFTATLMNYMMRVNMSVNIIAMVPPPTLRHIPEPLPYVVVSRDAALSSDSAPTETKDVIEPEKRVNPNDKVFDWTTREQGIILGGYFWGYASASFCGGTVAERWGPRRVIFVTMLLVSALTILSPGAAHIHYLALTIARLLNGLASGILFPALHALVARWAPPTEKGKFISALMGGSVGTVLTWSLSGSIIESWGWPSAFYIAGALGILWCALWWYAVYDNPVEHPRISETERQYIVDSLGDRVKHSKDKVIPPFKQIMTSFPFIAMIVLHFGSDWGLYLLMTAAPLYMKNSLGFNLRNAGALSSLPYLGRLVFAIIFGTIGDRIIKSQIVSLTVVRKCFTLSSHILPGVVLIILSYTTEAMTCVLLMTMCLAFNGASALTNLANHQDLSPNYAGTLYGIANGFGNCSGIITPLITAHFTKDGNTAGHWRPVFIIGAAVYIGTAIYFIVFGTSKTQPWNYYAAGGAPQETKAPNK